MSKLDDIINKLETKLDEVPKIVNYILGGLVVLLIILSKFTKPESSKIIKPVKPEDVSESTSNSMQITAISLPTYEVDSNLDYIRSGLFGSGYKNIPLGEGFGADRTTYRNKAQIAAGNIYHKGQDFSAPLGTKIYSPHQGKVIKVNDTPNTAGGRSITLEIGDYLLYLAHLSSVYVYVGQEVHRGQLIALSGGSGFGREKYYGYHLHIQMKHKSSKDWEDPSTIKLGYSIDDLAMIGIGFFLNNGYTLDQSCGLIGNFYAESRFKTDARNNQGGGKGAIGIAQWRGARITHFNKWKGKPLETATFMEQLQFVIRELTHPSIGGDGKYSDYSIVRFNSKYKQSSGVANCTKLVYLNYERPGSEDKSLKTRVDAAIKYHNMYLSLYGNVSTKENNSLIESNSVYRKDLNK